MIKLTAGMRLELQMIKNKSKTDAGMLKDDIIMSDTDESENTACQNSSLLLYNAFEDDFLQNATDSAGFNSEHSHADLDEDPDLFDDNILQNELPTVTSANLLIDAQKVPLKFPNFIVPIINFSAVSYVDMINWDDEDREPPMTRHISDETLLIYVTYKLENKSFSW
jgi:hypothetical protein